MQRLWIIGATLMALWLTGCPSVAREYVEADRLTLDAVGPEYIELVEGAHKKQPDGTFKPWFGVEDQKTRKGTIASWDYRVTQAEQQLEKEGK